MKPWSATFFIITMCKRRFFSKKKKRFWVPRCVSVAIVTCYDVLEWESMFTLGLNTAKNTHYMKKGSNKSCSELNFVQKVLECICLSPPWVELLGSKDQYVWNLIMYRNRKLDSLWGSTLPKIPITSKNLQIKVVRKWILYKKVTSAYVYPSFSGAKGLQRSVCLKSYNVQKWEIRFTLGLNAAKKYALCEL